MTHTEASALTAKGRNGQISFDGKTITIKREGMAARLSHGRSDKVLMLRNISAIQLKPVSLLTVGYIQFTVPGEMSNNKRKSSRTFDASKDENSVLFLKNQQPEFETLRNVIQAALADL